MQYLETGTFIALALAAIVFAYTNWRSNYEERSRSRPRPSRPVEAPRERAKDTAERMLNVVVRLSKMPVQWPEIFEHLNPTNDAEITAILNDLRGPHMFVPGTALAIVESACRETIKANPSAISKEALLRARKSMERVTRFGD